MTPAPAPALTAAPSPAVPAVMQIGAARITAGLDRYPRLDLDAHQRIFGRIPQLTAATLAGITQQVDLRGRGGAAFPFARKLRAVTGASRRDSQPPVVVINAAEGEPGSFKDAALLMRSPYLVLSGAVMTAAAIGASRIFAGVAEGSPAARSLEAAIAMSPELADLVHITRVPDRFISGESGALVRAINGEEPIPPGRKTRTAEHGVGGLPTLLSNAETFAQAAILALLGPERFSSAGLPEEPGTILLSVSGSAEHPVVAEVPAGVPLGDVLDACHAPAGDGVLAGGYHGMWLTAGCARQVPVSRAGFEQAGGTLGAGVVLPLGYGTCPLGEVSRVASYLARESAGQCGPCKRGLPRAAQALAELVDGSGGTRALNTARQSVAAAAGRGACAHPDGTARFIISALDVFEGDLAAHILQGGCGLPVLGVLPLPGQKETTGPQLSVDWTLCKGHGLCAHLIPEAIHLDSHGYPVLLEQPVPDWLLKDAKQAVGMCPSLALRLNTQGPGREP